MREIKFNAQIWVLEEIPFWRVIDSSDSLAEKLTEWVDEQNQ